MLFCKDDKSLIQRLNFGCPAGFDILKHAARVVLGRLQHLSKMGLKLFLVGKGNPFHGSHLSCLPVDHHAGIKQGRLEHFPVFQTRKGGDWIDGEVQ